MDFDFIKKLVKPAHTKIVLFVMDGLGGIQREPGGPTELEAAYTPHLDDLAKASICGLHQPIGPGITPGSGPSHLALFGYDPVKHQVGRGVMSALGIDFKLKDEDIAARGNFCTLDEGGKILDRRAGRISSQKNQELCRLLREIEISGVEIFVETVKEHRLVLVLRGKGLSGEISDTDPQEVGKKPLEPKPQSPQAARSAAVASKFLDQACSLLSQHHPANMILLRGFSRMPRWPSIQDVFGLKSAAIASYPMYRGVAKLVGMQVLNSGESFEEELDALEKFWEDFDYFYVHEKKIDSAGEDGDFDGKVALIEKADKHIPRILNLEPDVLIVTGDHSTPSLLKYHSWHPVPVLLWSKTCRADGVEKFSEKDCTLGGLGNNFPAVELMPLALAHAMRLEKFGA